MSKINFKYDEKEYTLEFTRQSVKTMEAQGFVLDDISTKPANMLPMLFAGAFIRNHKGIKRSLVDEMYDQIADKSEFLPALIEMYAETLSSLTDDKEDGGNVSWSVTK